MQITITPRELDVLGRTKNATDQTLAIPKGSIGDMTIANRLRGFGWLDRIEPRTFRLTTEGLDAINNGKVGTIDSWKHPKRKH
jgi:hypothetical protein